MSKSELKSLCAQNPVEMAERIVELEQRVKVLTNELARVKSICLRELGIGIVDENVLNATSQQIAEQIEQWHVEWMKTFKITDEMLAAGADMFEKTLHSSADFKHHTAYIFEAMCDAIPQLPETKESTK